MFGRKKNYSLNGKDYAIPAEVKEYITFADDSYVELVKENMRRYAETDRLRKILDEIAAMETPYANATVRRMAAMV